MNLNLGSAACPRGDFQPSADALGALSHALQTVMPLAFADLAHGRGQADAVVGDGQGQASGGEGEPDGDQRRLGVGDGVADGLLGDPLHFLADQRRDRLRAAFAKSGTDILGVSADSVQAQDKFVAKHKLKIPLASDETKQMLQAYGAWGEKSMYGRKYLGVIRKTFLIDGNGRIARVWPTVRVAGHAEEVLEAAKAL